jgi:hypothetical protein
MNLPSLLKQSMPTLRPGCSYCFETLAANDPNEANRSAVACNQCGHVYHKACWDLQEQCDACKSKYSHAVTLSIVPPLAVIDKKRAVRIQPSKRFHENQEDTATGNGGGGPIIIGQLIRALIVGVILAVLAVLAGIYTLPAWSARPLTFASIMDAIMHQPHPFHTTVLAGILTGVVFGWICFVSWRNDGGSVVPGKVSGFTKMLAGLVILTGFNIYLFRINLPNILDADFDPKIGPALYAEGITFFFFLIFTLIYQPLTPLSNPIKIPIQLPRQLAHALGWIWLAAVCVVLAGLVATLLTFRLSAYVNQPVLSSFRLGSLRVLVSYPFLVCMASALAVAAICCYPPAFRKLPGKTGLLRFLIIIACLAGVGYIFWKTNDPASLTSTLPYAIGLMILAIPLQRALS